MNPDLIGMLSGGVRRCIVRAKVLAFQGNYDAAMIALDAELKNSRPPVEEVAVRMTRAELQYLNGAGKDAVNAFDTQIIPLATCLPHEISIVVSDNRNLVAHAALLLESGYQSARVQDQRRLAGIELFDSQAILAGDEAVEDGQHYDALPIYWRELVRTHRCGSWRTLRWASKRMGRECRQLGWLDEAAYHATMAQDTKLAQQVGDSLVEMRDPLLASKAVQKLLKSANLLLHVEIASSFFEKISDILPDEEVTSIFTWLLPRSQIHIDSWATAGLVTGIWRTMFGIAHRLSPAQATELVRSATTHQMWGIGSPQRQQIIKVVNRCLSRLPPELLSEIAEMALPLGTHQKNDIDYREAVNLLAHLAERGGEEVKKRLNEVLYPPETGISALLLVVKSSFGVPTDDREKVNKWALKGAAEIALQVQRVGPGQEPVTVPCSSGVFRNDSPEGSIVISLFAGQLQLRALAEYRKLFSEESLGSLIDACIQMIRDEANLLTNRATLINCLEAFADVLTLSQAQRLVDAIEPFIVGEVPESSVAQSSSDAKNPLNRFRMGTGTVSEVRAASLTTLADLAKFHPGSLVKQVRSLVKENISSSDSMVRRFALAALGRMSLPGDDQAGSVMILASRDADPHVARVALRVLAELDQPCLSGNDCFGLFCSLKLAQQSSNVSLRASAAMAMRTFAPRLKQTVPGESLQILINGFDADASSLVRSCSAGNDRAS